MTKVRLRDGKVALKNGVIYLGSDELDDRPCKCCAGECGTLTVTVEWCGMTVTKAVAIPGVSGGFGLPDATLPDGSYMYVGTQIACTPCGWQVGIGICAVCVETNQFTGEAWEALVPFSDTPEAGGGYCPEPGAVTLTCFGDQFGIPCVTNAAATIA
jgi:hypothetical protein